MNRHFCTNIRSVTYSSVVVQRFWDKTAASEVLSFNGTPCIMWTGAIKNKKNPSLYGRFYSRDTDGNTRYWVAHRFAYYLAYGEVPDGMEVDHLCCRSLCVNALHLEAVTPCENTRRAEQNRVHSLTCPAGHLWTNETMRIHRNSKGTLTRLCRQCNRDRVSAATQGYRTSPIAGRELADLSTVCRNGHRRTSENTHFNSLGIVMCRDCRTDVMDRYKAKHT